MIELRKNPKQAKSKTDFSSEPQVRTIRPSGTHEAPPEGEAMITWGVYRTGGEKVAADYFASTPDAWFEDTRISLVVKHALSEERLEELRTRLQTNINALKEEKYSYFVEIVGEAVTPELVQEFEIAGRSSYVPG